MTAAAPESFDVFLSYHSNDALWVTKLKNALETNGLKVWLDSDQILPGDRFAEVLERGLQASRSVALIVSAGPLRSDWVKEEYYRALGLSNASGHSLRLIPVLIEPVPVPGFLASRSWADFRDPTKFDQSLERLRLGITGARPPDATKENDDPKTQKTHEQQTTPASDELSYLDLALGRELRTVRQLQRARLAAPVVGLAVFGVFVTVVSGTQPSTEALVALGAPLVTGLFGWGVTARQLSASKPNVTRLTCLREGLELCRSKGGAGCPKLWTEFWRVVHRNAGVDVA